MKKIIELSELDPRHWRPSPVFPNKYLVSDTGEVYSVRTKTMLRPLMSGRGYYYITLCVDKVGKRIAIHRLVAAAFIPNPEGKATVDHINGIKTDNRLVNLRWATPKENSNNPVTAEKNRNPVAVFENGKLIKVCNSQISAAKFTGLSHQTVSNRLHQKGKRKPNKARYILKYAEGNTVWNK